MAYINIWSDDLPHLYTPWCSWNNLQTTLRALLPIDKDDTNVLVGTSYPLVPNKLMKRIRYGKFIEMADILPKRLGAGGDSELTKSTKKWKIVRMGMLFWFVRLHRCWQYPWESANLMSYQALIIDAYTEYQGDHWSGYDRQFRQRAAVTPTTSWSTKDTTLWNLAFGGCISLSRCTHCLSVSQKSGECELSSDPHTSSTLSPYPTGKAASGRPGPQRQICCAWNEDPAPGCPHQAVGLSIYVIYALKMSGYKTKATESFTALITFKIDQPDHKSPSPTTNQLPKYFKEI